MAIPVFSAAKWPFFHDNPGFFGIKTAKNHPFGMLYTTTYFPPDFVPAIFLQPLWHIKFRG